MPRGCTAAQELVSIVRAKNGRSTPHHVYFLLPSTGLIPDVTELCCTGSMRQGSRRSRLFGPFAHRAYRRRVALWRFDPGRWTVGHAATRPEIDEYCSTQDCVFTATVQKNVFYTIGSLAPSSESQSWSVRGLRPPGLFRHQDLHCASAAQESRHGACRSWRRSTSAK